MVTEYTLEFLLYLRRNWWIWGVTIPKLIFLVELSLQVRYKDAHKPSNITMGFMYIVVDGADPPRKVPVDLREKVTGVGNG